MRIAALQRVTLIDYPGKIGATVFTQGCNFRCPYCHNPELVDPARYEPIISEKEVLSFLDKRRGKLDAVTVTGGEPSIHRSLGRFLETLREMGYLIKIDTNGSNPDVVEKIISRKLVDYLAMDVKGPLDKYGEIASVKIDTSKIRRSIEIITSSGIEHEFRTTILRSQLNLQDLISVARLIKKAHLYVLQPFVPSKILNSSFLSEASYSQEEFSTIRDNLEKVVTRVVIR